MATAAIALMRNDKLSDDELATLIPGPDYPGGGQIISSADEIRAAYATGRGSLKVRARWTIEDLARGQWQLVVNELPPGTSSQRVLEEIEELTNPKVKAGKKALGADQLALKASVLGVLDAVRDESSKDAPVRLVFEPKTSRIEKNDLITQLLAHTSLESSAPINLTMVGADGRPTQKTLRQMLVEWNAYRLQTVHRRSQHRLGKVLDRIHVLEGRQQVLLNIDEVIRIIRNADEPKSALIERFALSERQADDILEIRLRQLARLEAIKLEQELKELRAEQSKLEVLIGDASALRRSVIKEIEADVKQFGSPEKDPRRTLIQAEKKAVVEVRVVDEPVTVVVSQKGWVRTLKGHENEPSSLQFKSGDGLLTTFACRSVDVLLVFGTAAGGSGRVYSTPVTALPAGRGDGQPITTLVDLETGTQPAHYHAGALAQTLLLANSGGYGLMARVGDLVARQRGGKAFLSLEDGEQVLPPSVVAADESGHALSRVACLSAKGRLLVFAASELKRQPQGGRGLTLIDLDAGDALASTVAFAHSLQVIGTGRGGKAREEVLKPAACEPYVGKRARKGRAQDLMPKALLLRSA